VNTAASKNVWRSSLLRIPGAHRRHKHDLEQHHPPQYDKPTESFTFDLTSAQL
jgi:hypothetical protein